MEYNKKKVIFIDLDGTLIKTASGNTFPISISKIPKDHYSKENGSREYYIKKIEIE